MTKIEKPSILTPKTLLSGIAGISLIVGMSMAPVSFSYASGSNDSTGVEVSDSAPEADETANPAREAAENSMNNLGLNMENSAREIGDAAGKAADGMHKDAENKMDEHAKETSSNGSDHADGQNGSDHADGQNGSDHADGQQNIDENAPPMVLADFISSLRKGNSVTSSDGSTANLELRYTNGWKEEIDHGRYVLVDPNDNKIISRPVTDADISRMRSALK